MINAAIIGTGNIAPAHIEALLTFPERCRIVALVDIYPEKAEEMKKRFHLDGAQVFSSHEALLGSGLAVDVCHLCVPPYVHAPIAIDVMNNGWNVVVEKPMATCLQECDRMLEAEKRNGVTLSCIAQNRFRDSISKLKAVLDQGDAGRLLLAHVNSLWWRGTPYYDLWWRGTWEKEGGGPTLNHAVHHIDMINWMKRELPTEVTAVLANVGHHNSEVEDLSLATLQYRDGTMAQITSSVIHHGEEQGLVLQCEKAKLSAPWSCYATKSRPNGFPEEDTALESKLNDEYASLPNLPYEAHTGEIEAVLTALETDNRPPITGQDGRNTVELITAIYKSGLTKQTVSLPIKESDDFYTFEGLMRHVVRFYPKTASVENYGVDKVMLGNYEWKNKA